MMNVGVELTVPLQTKRTCYGHSCWDRQGRSFCVIDLGLYCTVKVFHGNVSLIHVAMTKK